MSARTIGLFLFFLPFLSFAHVELQKIKVDLSELSFEDDGIYYLLKNGAAAKIDSLYFENGQYTASLPRGIISDILGVWWCYNCRNWNSKYDTACTYCGEPR